MTTLKPEPPKPRVVHCKREKFDVYIGRPSKWGNPFRIGPGIQEAARADAIAAFRAHLMRHPELLTAAKSELRGKTLGCYCAPRPCHGDVLLEIANAD